MKPNLFSIATKELHQDAFIAWLIQWANPTNQQYNEALFQTGSTFLKALLQKNHSTDDLNITKVKVGRQWENVDVYVEVESDKGKFLIVIEDKTYSKERANQLERYRISGEKWCKQHHAELGCIYLKTGSESQKSLSLIKQRGFEPFNRKDFLKILNHYPENGSDILIDFRARLHQLQEAHDAFETTVITEWDDDCWIGFYQYLEQNMGINDWHLVNPPAGGQFWNAVLNWESWFGFPVYLQIEQGKLAFKISYIDSEIEDFTASEIRNKWYEVIRKNALLQNDKTIRRPERFGNGNYMTCAFVSKSDWLGKLDEVIDAPLVIKRLKHYKTFLQSILKVQR